MLTKRLNAPSSCLPFAFAVPVRLAPWDAVLILIELDLPFEILREPPVAFLEDWVLRALALDLEALVLSVREPDELKRLVVPPVVERPEGRFEAFLLAMEYFLLLSWGGISPVRLEEPVLPFAEVPRFADAAGFEVLLCFAALRVVGFLAALPLEPSLRWFDLFVLSVFATLILTSFYLHI